MNNGVPDIPNLSFSEFVFSVIKDYGERESIVDSNTGKSYTFSEVADLSRRVASGLLRRGMKVGDVLYMCIKNSAETLLTIIGTSAAGGVIAPANPFSAEGELKTQIIQSGTKYIIVEKDQYQKLLSALNQIEHQVKEIFVIGDGFSHRSFQELIEDDGSYYTGPPKINNPREAAHFIFFSSGTTGFPKAIVRTHYNMVATLVMYSNYKLFPLTSDDVMLCVLPLFYLLGLQMGLSGMIVGAKLVTVAKYRFENICRLIEKSKVTFMPAVPTILEDFKHHDIPEDCNLGSLRKVLTAGDMLKRATAFDVIKKLNLKYLLNEYGTSESGTVALTPIYDEKITVGPAVPFVEFKVVDCDTNESLNPYEHGELCVKGPMIMKGYLTGTLQSTNALTKDGWFRTGDLGYYDENRNIYLVDRKKNFIKYKGHQVSPSELEGILITHKAIESAAVVGVPDKQAGALPRAYITLKPEYNDFNETEIQKFVAERVAPHKQLRGGVVIVTEIPKSDNGKISRKTLQDLEYMESRIIKANLQGS